MKQYTWLLNIIVIMMTVSACSSTAAEYNNQGNTNFEEAAYDDALEEYTAAKEENQALAEPFYNSGNAYHNKGDLKAAIDQTQQALRMADDKLAQLAFYNLGNSYFIQEDWPAAIKNYQEALLLNPNDVQAKYNLELALRNVQRLMEQNGDGQPQQQPGQGGGQGQGEENQPQGEGEENEGGGEGEEEEQPGGGGEGEEEEQSGGGDGDLTEEEAEQLLDNLSQNSQTLQERLNQPFDGQGRRRLPTQDW